MGVMFCCAKEKKRSKEGAKLIVGLGIVFFMAVACNLTSHAYQGSNDQSEVEPNNTQETAQTTQPTYEKPERFAVQDFSGRCGMFGKATSSDDDWFKVDLPSGVQYLSVVHFYGDNATYVELLDSENKVIVPKKYGTRYNITEFDSQGGTYYIHITGASEKENQYCLYVGTPILSSGEVRVRFDPVNTSGTIRKSFSLADEENLPKDAYVAKITLRDMVSLDYSGALVSNLSSSNSVTFDRTSNWKDVGTLGMKLKNKWVIEYYPRSTVKTVPIAAFFYYYPVYDNTVYPHLPTIKK
ncbi:MAG: hypothetical protein HFI14_06865 [Lachnospiraceae bacterium]|nr:hypothetical protein [Lachnospiraceae bacterium]